MMCFLYHRAQKGTFFSLLQNKMMTSQVGVTTSAQHYDLRSQVRAPTVWFFSNNDILLGTCCSIHPKIIGDFLLMDEYGLVIVLFYCRKLYTKQSNKDATDNHSFAAAR